MGYMLPTLILFMSIGIILALTGLMLAVIAIFYRSREAIARSLGVILLGVSFLVAFQFQNDVLGNLQQFGYDLSSIRSLEIPKLNAFKGAPTGVPTGSWNVDVNLITLTQLVFTISIIILGYLGVQVMGSTGMLKYGLIALIVVLPAIGFFLSYQSTSSILNGDTASGIRMRDISNITKIIAILISLGLSSAGLIRIYRDVGERSYLIQGAGWLLLLIGLLIFGYMTLSSWENFAITEIQEGDINSPINAFRVVTFFLLVGSLGILSGSILEIAPIGVVGEAEEAEEETV